LTRLTVPVKLQGWKEPRPVRFFDELRKQLSAIDPGVELIPTGGPVRHTLARIYEDVYRLMQDNPKLSRDAAFKQLEAETGDVPVDKVIGRGGDVDVLFISSNPK